MDEIRDGITATAVRRRDAYYRRGLALADILAASLAMVLGVIVLGGDKVTLAFVAAIPLVVVVSKICGLYDRDEHLLQKTTLEEAPALFQLATLYTLAIWLCEGILVDDGTALAQGVNELGRDAGRRTLGAAIRVADRHEDRDQGADHPPHGSGTLSGAGELGGRPAGGRQAAGFARGRRRSWLVAWRSSPVSPTAPALPCSVTSTISTTWCTATTSAG